MAYKSNKTDSQSQKSRSTTIVDDINVKKLKIGDTKQLNKPEKKPEKGEITPPKKKLKSMMEAQFEAVPYSSMKEYMKARTVWNMAEVEGVEGAVEKLENSGGFSQSSGLAADDMLKFYSEIIKWQKQQYDTMMHKGEEGSSSSSSGAGLKEGQ